MKVKYKTYNFPLAIYLLCLGFQFLDFEGRGKKKLIVFEGEKEKLEKALEDWKKGKARVEPLTFYNNFRILKSRLIETRINNGHAKEWFFNKYERF